RGCCATWPRSCAAAGRSRRSRVATTSTPWGPASSPSWTSGAGDGGAASVTDGHAPVPDRGAGAWLRGWEGGVYVREFPGRDGAGGGGLGRVLLWLHGLGDSGVSFEQLAGAPELAGWRQLSPDLPGYGRSPWPAQPWDLAAQADHLAAWLRERGELPV